MVAYGQSNAARVMFAQKLGEKLKEEQIRVFSVDPGGKSCMVFPSGRYGMLTYLYSRAIRSPETLPS